ncbi:MAG: 2-amino-4-hydroxy-6-hydroxymethyldihydropteridine diphosphokinase, partial [Candidatus Omnitrophica bacterium]|nr:2-amino-4-hydroxy-6-hydroxymethyldihydropteridine diphosphokinase [Candidatus Omnitrophota bacterium]
MPIIYVGIGSNLGDRRHNIEQALEMLPENGICVRRCSTIIETAPVGGPPQGLYLNAVLEAETHLPPPELLTRLKSIEQRLGRTFTGRNGPRVIDLDILLYDDMVLEEQGLVI